MRHEENKVAIMQPYFLPYIGYWQLINFVDTFVLYDNVEFSKSGWINRNRYFLNGRDELFSLPLKNDSDHLHVYQRYLAENFEKESRKIQNKIASAYVKAPYFAEGIETLNQCLVCESRNLFDFVYGTVRIIAQSLKISTKIIVSSSLDVDPALKAQDRVISICNAINATDYVNPIGGIPLYSRSAFEAAGVGLHFHKVKDYVYDQYHYDFIPHLSIIDVIMFNGLEGTRCLLKEMELI